MERGGRTGGQMSIKSQSMKIKVRAVTVVSERNNDSADKIKKQEFLLDTKLIKMRVRHCQTKLGLFNSEEMS